MKALLLGALLITAPFAGWAAEAPPPVPPEVLAQAAQIEAAARQKAEAAAHPPAAPSAETLKIADDVDVLLLTARVLLDQQEPVKAGNRFIAAVKALEDLPRPERKALGARYQDQRRQLTDLSIRLLADPDVAAALGTGDDAGGSPAVPPADIQVEKPDPR